MVDLPSDGGTSIYILLQGIGAREPISAIRKSLPVFLHSKGYRLKADILPIFTLAGAKNNPIIKGIKVNVSEQRSIVEQSAKSTTSKKTKKLSLSSFMGRLSLGAGILKWADFAKAKDKNEYIEEKLKGFYTIDDVPTNYERSFSLEVEINKVNRTLPIRINEKFEFSMSFDITDEIVRDKEGKATIESLEKKAIEYLEIIKK